MDQKYFNHRFLNAGLFSLPLLLAAFGTYSYSQPFTYVVRGESAIVCSNQKIYPAAPNDILETDKLFSYTNGKQSVLPQDLKQEDIKARKLCAYGVIHDFLPFRPIPQEPNYTVRLGTSVASIDTFSNTGVTLSQQ